MERGRRNGGFEIESNGFHGAIGYKSSEIESIVVASSSSSSPARSFVHPPSPPSPSYTNLNYIQHRVTKMDTLAGIAIKYGVEVDGMLALVSILFFYFYCHLGSYQLE